MCSSGVVATTLYGSGCWGPGFASLVELRLPFHHGSGGWFVIAIHDSKKLAFTNVQTLKLHKYPSAGDFLLLRVEIESP